MIRMVVPVLLVIGTFVLVYMAMGALGGSKQPLGPAPAAPKGALSLTQWTVLSLTGLLAFSGAIALAILTDGFWWAIPVAAWIAGLIATRRAAKSRGVKAEAEEQAAQEAHIDELSKPERVLLENAEAAVKRIQSTEAAQAGWLGDPADLDFSADLQFIANNTATARRLRNLIFELGEIPNPSPADRTLITDAEREIDSLAVHSIERTRLLESCAERAERIDESLREDRENERNELHRDEVRARMSALLYGTGSGAGTASPTSTPSASADRVVALTAAFQELKDTIDFDRTAAGMIPRDLDR